MRSLPTLSTDQVLISAVLVGLSWLIFSWWRSNARLPPGPWGLPFLGYFPFIRTTHEDFLSLSKVYGNVFSFRTVGGRIIIVLSSARVIRDVLVNRADEFIGKPGGINLIEWVSDGIGITQEEGRPWQEQRRFFLHTAKSFGFGKTEMQEPIHDEIRRMLKQLRVPGSRPRLEVGFASSCVISQVLFGRRILKDRQFAENLEGMEGLVSMFIGNYHLLIGTPFKWITSLPQNSRFAKGKESLRRYTNSIVEDIVRTYDPSESPRCYVEAFLQQMKQEAAKEGTSFTMARLQAISMNLYFEGTESVGSSTFSLLLELSRHRQVQKQIQQELDSVVGRERLPCWTDRQQLPFLEAAIQELYRTASLFLVSTMYSNFNETTIEGYRIPKRSVIVANLWSINSDPSIYPEPHKFNPNRFLSEDGKKIKTEGPYPFGIGKRSCIGESLAQMEVFLFISAILQNFTLSPTPDSNDIVFNPRA